ncbi:MAG TPA: HK97 family phage prohead protease [Ruminococcus sp.]|nr:HK97 family phage prohead protease [Ruminococcus sp.]
MDGNAKHDKGIGGNEMENRDIGARQARALMTNFEVRSEENGDQYIEGYFAVFNSNYDMGGGLSESIAPGAFTDSLSGDIRCLTNHDTRLVLGRTSAHTFEVRQDEHGLWGRVLINPNDQDAMNTKARVNRGDINQASIGFDIISEDTDIRDDGSIHWTIRKIKLYECSVVTFPAYEETNLAARSNQREEIQKRSLQAWRENARKKLKGE